MIDGAAVNILDYDVVGDGSVDETAILNKAIAENQGRLISIPEFITIKIDSVKTNFTGCLGLVGNGLLEIENEVEGFTKVGDDFILDGLTFNGEVNFWDSFRIEGAASGTPDTGWAKNVTVRNCTFRNSHPEGVAQQYLCFYGARMNNMTFVNNRVTRGATWFREQNGVLIDGNNLDADRAGYQVRSSTAGADCIKLTGSSWGVISNNILENAGRDGIDAFEAGQHLVITGNTIRNFYTEGIEIKSVEGGPISQYISITGNVITDGGYDSLAAHAAIWVDDNDSTDSIHDVSIVGNVISNIGDNAGVGALYTGVRCTSVENVVIADNIISDIHSDAYTEYAINITGTKQGIVSGNVITGDERGISAGTLSDTIISGNKITTNRTDGNEVDIGLYFSGTQTNVRVEGNTVHANGRAINAEGTTWDKVFVHNNTLLSNSGDVVWLGSLSNCSFVGNYIESTDLAQTDDGLYMSSQADEGTIIANNVTNNCRYGIYLRNSIGAIVTGNRANNVDYGVFVAGGNYNIIKNNVAINADYDFQAAIGANSIVSDNLRVM